MFGAATPRPQTAAKMDELEQRILSVLGGRSLRTILEALLAQLDPLSAEAATRVHASYGTAAPAPAPAAQPPADNSLEQMVEAKLVGDCACLDLLHCFVHNRCRPHADPVLGGRGADRPGQRQEGEQETPAAHIGDIPALTWTLPCIFLSCLALSVASMRPG